MWIRPTAFAAALLLVALPAGAQTARQDDRSARAASLDYGDCLVARFPEEAEQVLLSDLDNDEILRRYRRLIDTGCMGRATDGMPTAGVRYSGDNFRYMLGEALVRRHFATAAAPAFDAVPPLPRADIVMPVPDSPSGEAQLLRSLRHQEDENAEFAERRTYDILSRLGECVARVAPEPTRQLALTDPGTPAETSALAALRPAIAQCIPPATTIRLRPAHVRGAAAMNYFRLARAATSTSPSAEDGTPTAPNDSGAD